MSRKNPLCFLVMLAVAATIATLTIASPVRAEGVVVGVDLPTVDRMSANEQDKMLNALHASGVHVIRTWIVNDSSYDFVRKAFALGIKADLTVSLLPRPDAKRRPTVEELPTMYPNYPLSAVDPDLTKAAFETQLNKLEAMGMDFVAFEVGNEQNNPSFNGEFPIHAQGECAQCGNRGRDYLEHDSEGQNIAGGMRHYVEILAAIKDVRDHSKLNRRTPVVLGGLADNGAEVVWPGARANQVSIRAAIEYLRKNGLDNVVDAYGIHTYPWANGPGQSGPMHNRQNRLEEYALSECQPAGRGKPCWITEWGVQNEDDSCPPKEDDRARLIRELMADDFRPYVQQKRVLGLLYWLWQSEAGASHEEPHTIYRCGTLTDSGRLAIDVSLLH
jgi:hypothetical protein